MASVNKVILVGNLGRDPEIRYSADGLAVCSITIATSISWNDKNSGERKEETEWHRVVMYRRLAEIAGQYLKKGSSVYIEGRLKTRKWTDKDGVDRYTTEVIADQMKMLGGRVDSSGSADDSFPPVEGVSKAPVKAAAQQRPAAPAVPSNSIADLDDDIPF